MTLPLSYSRQIRRHSWLSPHVAGSLHIVVPPPCSSANFLVSSRLRGSPSPRPTCRLLVAPRPPASSRDAPSCRLRRPNASAHLPTDLCTRRTVLCAPLIQLANHRRPTRLHVRWWRGKESNLRSPRATDLQSAAFDRFATSPAVCVLGIVSFLTLTCGPERPSLELAKGFEPPTG